MEDINTENEIILEQWKTCVEMADSISRRRDVMNGVFVTIVLALIATASVIFNYGAIIISIAGIAFCVVWFLLINYFKVLNDAKYKVINEIESLLPIKAFTNEWEYLKKEKYIRHTKIEKSLPLIFGIVFLLLGIGATLFMILGGE